MNTYLVGHGESRFADEDFILLEAESAEMALETYTRRHGAVVREADLCAFDLADLRRIHLQQDFEDDAPA